MKRVFYFCPGHNVPRGGNKHTYRHVDILNEAGIWAAAFHLEPGFERLTWFDNETRVLGRAEFQQTFSPDQDLLVLPEDMGSRIANFPGRKVIFNKNIFYGAGALGRSGSPADPCLDPSVIALFAVSDHNAEYLRFAYPQLPVYRVHPEIDCTRFNYRPLSEKRQLIATNAKSASSVLALFHLLRARAVQDKNVLEGFEWVFLEHFSESETARFLSEALIFVFLSHTEGFGRMPVEAMASGCLVVAHDILPMRAFLPELSRFEVGNITGMAQLIERVAAAAKSGTLPEFQSKVDPGRALASRYSLAVQRDSVLAAWRSIFDDAESTAGRSDTRCTPIHRTGFAVIESKPAPRPAL